MGTLRTRSTKAVWAVHRWLGLLLGAFILVISATGGLLVVQREIGEVTGHAVTIVTPRPLRAPLATILSNVQTRAPAGMRLRSLIFDPDPAHSIRIQLTKLALRPRYVNALENRLMYASVDPYTGRVLDFRDENSVPDRWIRTLHVSLFAGRIGVIVTTLAAFTLLIQCFTGIWIYRGALTGLWKHPFRRRLGWRTALRDLHRWLGVGGLALNLIWGATGAYMMVYSLPSLLASPAFSNQENRIAWDVKSAPALEALVVEARRHFPTAELGSIDLPLFLGEPITVSLLQRNAAVWAKFPSVQFDSATGALLRVIRPEDASFWAKTQASIKPLHFGFFGSIWTKWVYFVAAWVPALLALSGLLICKSSTPASITGRRK